ncbi:hypothetical protein ACPXCE_18400 [Streptomyces sp. DT24]|uniref:hypothetical protein n=1 Tax=unclassified Streptomyces TaxID=2593676 RepID=UPI0023B8F5E7|nr:hypothetical protein [Streptomyces sp. AM 4-1-1]WEH32199.1 hypothetical protein PZB75_01675 [Streptomyces sp. AM 4-1-1]
MDNNELVRDWKQSGPRPAAVADHPAGEVLLGAGGALGRRSRLLGGGDRIAGYTHDLPFTTMTSPL